MKKNLKKYYIKIPKSIKVFYYKHLRLIIFIGPITQKIIRPKFELMFNPAESKLQIDDQFMVKFFDKKMLSSFKGILSFLIKQAILEVSVLIYKKLRLVGVGYKVFTVKKYFDSILEFKLGFSHSIFFKVISGIQVLLFKSVNIYILGNSCLDVMTFTAKIRSYKFPEPYKGKGILYDNEKLILKEGKKI